MARSPQPRTGEGISWLALLPAVAVLLLRFWYPELLENEAGKLIPIRRMVEPGFLSHDWLEQLSSGDDRAYVFFSALAAPLWLLLKQAVLVAMAGRLLLWAALCAGLRRLAQALELPAYSLAIGLAVWVVGSQSLGAGEWVFGGMESKCLAYALIFFGLAAALERRMTAASLYFGFALLAHGLVGGWAVLALGIALLGCWRCYGLRAALQFAAVTTAFLLALLGFYLLGGHGGHSEGSAAAADRIVVLFRNPHHIDPLYFHGGRELLIATAMAAVAVFALWALAQHGKAVLLCWFMAAMLAEFGAGLLARRLEWFWFLKCYPFRLTDVMVGLFFWLLVPALAAEMWRLAREAGAPRVLRYGCALVVALVAVAMLVYSAGAVQRRLATARAAWERALRHQPSAWEEMTAWIAHNTPQDSVVLGPPWEGAFWLQAERAEVVNFKRAPHGSSALEWHRRMVALNGGEFLGVGGQAVAELRGNYPLLPAAQVLSAARSYGAQYYLSTTPRAEFNPSLVHQSGEYCLYRLPD